MEECSPLGDWNHSHYAVEGRFIPAATATAEPVNSWVGRFPLLAGGIIQVAFQPVRTFSILVSLDEQWLTSGICLRLRLLSLP